MSSSFKSGDKFILEIGDRQLDEYEITGTDYYIKIYLLKKLEQYNPTLYLCNFINKTKKVLNIISDSEMDEYNNIYNDKSSKEAIDWINKKYEEYFVNKK